MNYESSTSISAPTPATTASTSATAENGNRQYQYQLLNYQVHEVYLRPLLDKHQKCNSLCYEDLIKSWNKVEQWQRQRQQQRQHTKAAEAASETIIESQIIEKVGFLLTEIPLY